jgi:virginiamycin B lyase
VASLRRNVAILAAVAALTIGILAAYSSEIFQSFDRIPETTDDRKGIPIDISDNDSSTSSNPYVKEFSLPEDTWPNGIRVDREGTVWTVGARTQSLIALDPVAYEAKSYRIPEESGGSRFAMGWDIAEDRDGSILFSGSGRSPIWRFDPEGERFELIDSPSGAPIQIKLDDQGRIWYTLLSSGIVGVAEQKDSVYEAKEFKVGEESFPSGIFVQNGTLWVTKIFEGSVVQFDISTKDGAVTGLTEVEEFPRDQALVSPNDILVLDSSAWITEHNTSFVTKYDTATHEMTKYPTSLHPVHVVSLPYWLEPAGNEGIWFNEHKGNRIAFFDLSSVTLTEYEIPTRNPELGGIANALTISVDPSDQNILWFTEFTEDKIGFVDRSVPVPFDLRASEAKITIAQGGTATIDLEVLRKNGIPIFNNTLSFGVSSSTISSGVLVNATATFSPDKVDLSEFEESQNVTLELNDEGLEKGVHVLAISATDGAVTRTAYVEIMVV